MRQLNSLNQGESYLVGGCVRDLIGGEREPADFDIVTNIPMRVIESIFDCVEIGMSRDFGILAMTIGAVLGAGPHHSGIPPIKNPWIADHLELGTSVMPTSSELRTADLRAGHHYDTCWLYRTIDCAVAPWFSLPTPTTE